MSATIERATLLVTTADLANLSLLGKLLHPILQRARVVASAAMPPDVVTMNSRVRLAYATTGVRRLVTLVYPADAAAALDRISVLEPLGMALLGARVGQVLHLPGPRPRVRLRIEALLHQPERSLREGLVLRAPRLATGDE